MSREHSGMRQIERGIHAAQVHAIGFDVAPSAPVRETKKATGIRTRKPVERKAEAEQRVKEATLDGRSFDDQREHFLAELESVNDTIDAAGSETEVNLQRSRKMDVESKLAALGREREEKENLKSTSPAYAFQDAVHRYMTLGAEMQKGEASIDRQQQMRLIRTEIDALVPKVAKDQLEAELQTIDVKQSRKMLERRLAELDSMAESLDDHEYEMVEIDIVKEKLRQLAEKEVATPSVWKKTHGNLDSDPVLKGRETRVQNEIRKLEQTRANLNWWNPFRAAADMWRIDKDLIAQRELLEKTRRERAVVATAVTRTSDRIVQPGQRSQEQRKAA